MDSLFSMFHKIIITGGAIVSSVLLLTPQHASRPALRLLPTPSVVSNHAITIDKTITAMGKNVTVLLTMPKEGGTIDGSISGDCQGIIDGTYSGQTENTFNGRGQVTCSFGFLSLPADAAFNGILHPGQKTAAIHYVITSGSNFSKTGDITVGYSE